MSQSKSARRTLTAAVANPAPASPAVTRVTKAALSDEIAAIRRKLAASENAVESWKATAERASRLYHDAGVLTVRQAQRIGELQAAVSRALSARPPLVMPKREPVQVQPVVALIFATLAGAAAALAAVYAPLSAVLS